jgi:hypothetical protein
LDSLFQVTAALAVLTLVACSAPPLIEQAPPGASPAAPVLRVDAADQLGEISPLVYGVNYGPWMPLNVAVFPLAETGGFKSVRFPGGEWGDTIDLQGYQIDQLVSLARQFGMEPFVHVRLPGGAPDMAADLVRYANVEKGYGIKHWAIGNEPSLYQQFPDRAQWDTAYYNQQWRQFAEAMRAVDPTILLVGPEIHQWTGGPADPKDSAGRDWLEEFLKANGDLVDIVAVHRYPFPDNAENTPASLPELLANAPAWDDLASNLRQTVRAVTGKDLPIAITEANSHWSRSIQGEATPDSFANAVWWADVLGRLIRQRVAMVNYFSLASGDDVGHGLLSRSEGRPTYDVYKLYQQLGDQLLAASSADDDVSILAARRADGALTLMLVNRGQQEARMPLELEGFTPAGPAQVWRMDAEHRADQLDDVALADGATLTLPPLSATLYVIP